MAKVEVWLHTDRVWVVDVRPDDTPPFDGYDNGQEPGIDELLENGPKKIHVDPETIERWHRTSADFWRMQDRLRELAEQQLEDQEGDDDDEVLPEGTD